MRNLKQLLLIGSIFLFTAAHAEEPPPFKAPNTPTEAPVEDVDAVITNKKMRAASGSKSKYSISTGLNYSGGDLTTPLGTVRPNISGATGSTDVALLSASISGKYTLTPQSSLFAGMGVRWITPLAGTQVPTNYPGDKVDTDNPGISYQYLYRWFSNIQSAFQLSETIFTNSNLLHYGYLTAWGLSQNNVYEVPHTPFVLGFTLSGGFSVYTKNDAASIINQSDYNFSILPFFEFKLTDRIDLHTDSNILAYQHVRSETRGTTFQKQIVTQSFGVGASITRDFYVSLSLLWVAGNLTSDKTLTSVGANLNLF